MGHLAKLDKQMQKHIKRAWVLAYNKPKSERDFDCVKRLPIQKRAGGRKPSKIKDIYAEYKEEKA